MFCVCGRCAASIAYEGHTVRRFHGNVPHIEIVATSRVMKTIEAPHAYVLLAKTLRDEQTY